MQRHWGSKVIREVRKQQKGHFFCKGGTARVVKMRSVGESARHSLCSSCWQSKVFIIFGLSRFAVPKLGTKLPRVPQETHILEDFNKLREIQQFLTSTANHEVEVVHNFSIRLCYFSFFFSASAVTLCSLFKFLFIYLLIFGCVGSSMLHAGFL